MENKTLNEVLEGVTRFEVIDYRDCIDCDGLGMDVKQGRPCSTCAGGGIRGRQVIFHSKNIMVEASLQDEEKTLKLFVGVRPETL